MNLLICFDLVRVEGKRVALCPQGSVESYF